MSTPAIARLVQASTAQQGLPERLEDGAVALRIGRLLRRTMQPEGAGSTTS